MIIAQVLQFLLGFLLVCIYHFLHLIPSSFIISAYQECDTLVVRM